jgi:hypothetical protein
LKPGADDGVVLCCSVMAAYHPGPSPPTRCPAAGFGCQPTSAHLVQSSKIGKMYNMCPLRAESMTYHFRVGLSKTAGKRHRVTAFGSISFFRGHGPLLHVLKKWLFVGFCCRRWPCLRQRILILSAKCGYPAYRRHREQPRWRVTRWPDRLKKNPKGH